MFVQFLRIIISYVVGDVYEDLAIIFESDRAEMLKH